MHGNWSTNNKKYWNDVSFEYESGYEDKWSLLENEYIKNQISIYTDTTPFKVLDLGCGDGLGYRICKSINPNIEYIGIDISEEMLKIMKSKYPEVNVRLSDMSHLTEFDSCSFDLIIGLFTSFSYTHNIESTVNEICRVLKPGGKILLSVISRYSLRRLFSLKFGETEQYQTRGIKSNSFSYSWTFTKRVLFSLFQEKFVNVQVFGYNSFAGIALLSRTFFWKLSMWLSKLYPNTSHELIVSAKKSDV